MTHKTLKNGNEIQLFDYLLAINVISSSSMGQIKMKSSETLVVCTTLPHACFCLASLASGHHTTFHLLTLQTFTHTYMTDTLTSTPHDWLTV